MPPNDTRLGVFLRVGQKPAWIEIQFPENELARLYGHSIKKYKPLLESKFLDTVRIQLPSSALDVGMSRALEAIVIHFDNDRDAHDWADYICREVENEPRQVYVKQYWTQEEFEQLWKTLRERFRRNQQQEQMTRPDRVVPPPARAKPSPAYVVRLPDRAGPPPGHARGSRARSRSR